MTADNAKKAIVAPKVEVKVVEAVKEAKAADADAAADAKKPVKKSEQVKAEKVEKKDAKPQALAQGIVASDVFAPTHSNAEVLREVNLKSLVNLK